MNLVKVTALACLLTAAIPISAVRADVLLDTNWSTYDNWQLTTGNYFAAPFKATSLATIETFSVLLAPTSGTDSLTGSKIEIFRDITIAPTNPANLVGTLNFSSSAPSGSLTIASYQGSLEITEIGNYFYKLSGISGNAWIRKGNPGSPSPWEIVVPGAWYLNSDTKAGDYTATYYSKFKIEGSLPPADSDGDGIIDDEDEYPSADTEESSAGVTLQTIPPTANSGCSIGSLTVADVVAELPGVAVNGIGKGISFGLSGCDTNNLETLTIKIDLGAAPAEGSVAMKIDSDGNWSQIEGATIEGSVVTYTITDNGPLDEDPDPGAMDDPVTVAIPYSEPALPVPTLPALLLGLMSLLIGLFGYRRLAR